VSSTVSDEGFHSMTVVDVVRDTDDSVVVTLDPGGAGMRFVHGQHLTLRRFFGDVEVRRSYSICSTAPDGPLRVAIKRVPGGTFSTWANESVAVGDRIEVMAPAGHFTHALDPEASRRYALLAAGSGITPVLSIMSTILECEPRSGVDLLYVNRTSRSTMLLEELEDVRDRHLGRVRISYLFTREPAQAELLSGRPDRDRLDALVAVGLLPADVDQAFLCGPLELTNAARAALLAAGLPSDRIHRELFTGAQLGSPPPMAPQAIDDTMSVVATGSGKLHGRAIDIDFYEGDSVLDAMQRVRPDTPFSCRSGVCSTCQAKLVSGTVEMAVNYGLEDDDLARGYVLTCQARPTTAVVTVDYDV
jgi:ring-1,2-phenylacetyl-CoA epoxidase subunit PaaE